MRIDNETIKEIEYQQLKILEHMLHNTYLKKLLKKIIILKNLNK